MNLNNTTSQMVDININTANGRAINVEVNPVTFHMEDLSRYQEPFDVKATVGSQSAGKIEGLDGSETISVFKDGEKFVILKTE